MKMWPLTRMLSGHYTGGNKELSMLQSQLREMGVPDN